MKQAFIIAKACQVFVERVSTRQGQQQAANDLAGVAKKKNEYVWIRIPASLSSRIGRRLPKTEFRSLDQYVAYVLDQLIFELEQQQEGNEDEESNRVATAAASNREF